jgi:hypothetical protein
MPRGSISPEARLLLLAAGGARNDDAIRDILAGPFDWPKLCWLAESERAAPVMWNRLRSLGQPLPAAAQPLSRLAMVSEFRMLHLEQRLVQTLDALAARGIDAVLLKGAALAITAYGSFTRRPMFDLDILLERSRAWEARSALLGAGWTSSGLEDMAEFYEGHHHLPALSDASGTETQLELHTELFFEGHPFRLSADDVRRRATPISVQGRPAWVPSMHDQLLHLCLHFAWSHMMAAGAWRAFRDLDTLLSRGGVEWDGFIELARESRGATSCYWTFRLARQLVGIEVPERVLAALRPPQPEFALRRLEQHFTHFLLPTEAICPAKSVAYAMWEAGVRPGWSGHGTVRPWDRADDLLGAQRPTKARRIAEHVMKARVWARYASVILLNG